MCWVCERGELRGGWVYGDDWWGQVRQSPAHSTWTSAHRIDLRSGVNFTCSILKSIGFVSSVCSRPVLVQKARTQWACTDWRTWLSKPSQKMKFSNLSNPCLRWQIPLFLNFILWQPNFNMHNSFQKKGIWNCFEMMSSFWFESSFQSWSNIIKNTYDVVSP